MCVNTNYIFALQKNFYSSEYVSFCIMQIFRASNGVFCEISCYIINIELYNTASTITQELILRIECFFNNWLNNKISMDNSTNY